MSFLNDNDDDDNNLLNFEEDKNLLNSEEYIFNNIDYGYQLLGLGSYNKNIPCFLKSTKILTIDGEKKIEELKKGDLLICYDKRKIEIKDIYCFTCKKLNKTTLPYKIPKNTKINNEICNDDLYLSPLHQILFYKNLFKCVKNLKFKQIDISEINADSITYYHIVLPNYYTDAIIANGVICEGFLGNLLEQNLSEQIIHNKIIFSKIYKNKCRKLITKNEYDKIINSPKSSTIIKHL